MKRKIFALLCCIFLLFCLCSCTVRIDGYENFKINTSDYELDHYILPSEDFVNIFPNIGLDYHFRDEYSIIRFVERSFIVIEYEKETYEIAKEYCLQNMQLSDADPLEYNNYIFIENIELAVKQNRYENPGSFPHWFNMFAYNDNMNCLVFMGFYGSIYKPDDSPDVRDHWGEFIEKHFSDLYDWKNTPDDLRT